MQKNEIDAVDRKIIAILQKDGRITNLRLSEAVGLSPSACLARHRRLEKLGIIKGYRAEIDLAKLRPHIRVMVQMRLARHSTSDFRHLGKLLQDDERVVEAAEISGGMDYHASLCLRDMDELRDFIDDLTERAPVIEAVNSFIVLHEAKAATQFSVSAS